MGRRNLEVRMSASMEDNLEAIFQFLQSKEFGFFPACMNVAKCVSPNIHKQNRLQRLLFKEKT